VTTRTDVCSRPHCDLVAARRQLCNKHYRHWRNQNTRVSVEAVRAHIGALNAAGVNNNTIARTAGVSWRSVYGITSAQRQDQTTVRADIAHAILNLSIPARVLDLEGAVLVSNCGTQRRLQALIALGYTNLQLAQGMSMRHREFCRLLNYDGSYVTVRYARAAADLFNRLELTEVPSTVAASRSRNRAQRNNWALPLQWDEDTIDDPAAKPIRITKRGGTAIDRIVELRDHLGIRDINQIAEHLGIETPSVKQALRRAERIAS
jgi:predicted ArsR family transcriptional regulator